MSWNPLDWSGIGDIPIVGDVYKGVFGDPEAVKAAYDKQIAASQQQAKEMRDFLMGQKGAAQAFYGPIQHMFNRAYGTEGIQGPMIPGATGGRLDSMYQNSAVRGGGNVPPMPGGGRRY